MPHEGSNGKKCTNFRSARATKTWARSMALGNTSRHGGQTQVLLLKGPAVCIWDSHPHLLCVAASKVTPEMLSSSSRRLALLTLVVVVSLSLADDAPSADEKTPAETRSAADPATPQTRFLPGIGNVFNNIFNSCSRCISKDLQFANSCCQSGHRQCCFQGSFGQGFGNGFVPGFGGGFGPGFSNPGFAQPGFNGGFGSHPGFGGNFGGGFAQPGFPGQFGQSGFGFPSNVKPGFCPKQGFFGPKTRSGANADPALRSAAPAGDAAAAGAEGGRARRSGQEFSSQRSDAHGPPAEEEDRAAITQLLRSNRRARQATVDAPVADSGTTSNNNPNTRFLPNPFGPGSLIPNPFCRDECFNDFDCPGSLKCCLRDCRKCQNPSFF